VERRQPRPRSTKRVNVRIKGPMAPPIGLTLRSHVPHTTAAEHVRHEAGTQPRPRAESAEETTEGAATKPERNPGLVPETALSHMPPRHPAHNTPPRSTRSTPAIRRVHTTGPAPQEESCRCGP